MIENVGDYSCLDPVYLDDAAFAVNLGANVNLFFFRYAPVIKEGGALTYERAGALSLVLPWASMICKKPELFFSAASLNPPPGEAALRARLACN